MKFINRHNLAISIFLFVLLFICLWPLYQYIFDVDGIGYAAVAHHYINGDWVKAVNGFWNPLHSWLVIPFMKTGLSDGAAFKISNAFIAVASLYFLYRLLHKFELNNTIKTCIQFCGSILLLHYAYYELAADVLFVLLMLMFMNLYADSGFYNSISKNVLAGILGALLYFSKSYGFPFFIFHFAVIHIFLNGITRKSLMPFLCGFLVFFLLCFLWMMALYWKYGEWMIAFGKYNAHWSFSTEPQQGPLLQPPPYETSAAVWEDPWFVKKDNLQKVPFTTIALQQIRTALYNTQHMLLHLHELSFFAPVLLMLFFMKGVFKKSTTFKWLLVSMITLPSGYILLHFETRFIWALSFILMIGGALILENFFSKEIFKSWQQLLIWLVFFGSFLLYPVDHLKDSAYAGKDFYETAAFMKQNNIKGSFTSNKFKSESMVIAYLSGTSYYNPKKLSFKNEQLLQELKQYHIPYYFYYYSSYQDKESFLSSTLAREASRFIEMRKGLLVAVFSVEPAPQNTTR
jgi:hypothetical protein